MIKILTLAYTFLIVSCKESAKEESTNTSTNWGDNFVVVDDFEDFFIQKRDNETYVLDFLRTSIDREYKDPESALTLEFMTKGSLVAWCRIAPVDKHPALKTSYYQGTSFGHKEDKGAKAIAVRLQLVDEELYVQKKEKKIRPRRTHYDVLIANTDYYCAYIDHEGNQYIAKFTTPTFKPVKYHKYQLKGKIVDDLKAFNSKFVPSSSYVKELINKK